MSLQFLADGLFAGALIGLGAVGLTLTYSILRFSNFTHGDFISWGAYLALGVVSALTGWIGPAARFMPFSFGWPLIVGGLFAMALTGLLALALDAALFKPLRRTGHGIVMVIASFGASLALRAMLEFLFTSEPAYFSRAIQIAIPIGFGIRVTPDQAAMMGLALVVVIAMHLLLTRTHIGRSMRAVSENPALARVVGIDVAAVIRATWLIGGALACVSGIMLGLTVQIRPQMGFDLLLPLFAAAILGGIGSVWGAIIGGLIVGIAEAGAVQVIGSEYRSAVAFVLLIAMLLVRPRGLFGVREG
ncbi:branched-chain amino acid ABC transporter permease [Mesorhizobium sp. BR1-1-16]|uniref:branched-chain amino acid ABC transporter permease n=1 Tax=Mesorhizobium sp. BR1-1-16 TaxID=2876653 RepID=UPI001CCBA78E|nr:branched-chain amino acid ABC transporter permease [Mesorhizobium sp. BR1-1-16]MBZ9938319.1 branched-chain amino acid ABC transporter permease [Mesorhizobium sp. BR1-1-16]